jgi:hypothetical protein
MKLTEEYCWVITQLAGQSFFGRTGFGVLEFWFQLDFFYIQDGAGLIDDVDLLHTLVAMDKG